MITYSASEQAQHDGYARLVEAFMESYRADILGYARYYTKLLEDAKDEKKFEKLRNKIDKMKEKGVPGYANVYGYNSTNTRISEDDAEMKIYSEKVRGLALLNIHRCADLLDKISRGHELFGAVDPNYIVQSLIEQMDEKAQEKVKELLTWNS